MFSSVKWVPSSLVTGKGQKDHACEPGSSENVHSLPLPGCKRSVRASRTVVYPGASHSPFLSLHFPGEVASEGAYGHSEIRDSGIPGVEPGWPESWGPPCLAQMTSPEGPISPALDQAISGNKTVRELASLALFIVWELGIF